MGKYKAKLATQKYVEEKIGELALVVSSPDEAVDEGVYKVIDGAGSYILITQTVGEGISPIRQSKITSDGVIYSREFDIFEPPFPEFTQSTASQNDMALFKIIVDSQFTAIEDELERQRIITSAEGESIVLPDSADAKFRDLKVMGKTEQGTTTGAQLIKYPFAYSNGFEKNGITYTYADSVLSVSGTSTDAGSWFDFNNGVQLPAGDYTLSYVADSEADKSGAKFYVRDADANVVLTELNMGTATKRKTFTLTEDKSNIRIYMTVTGIVTLKGQIKLQLQSGKTATQFEPFTGGVPAPNVNYPQPLNSIGDDGGVDVNVKGHQLFDATMLPSGGVTTSVEVVNNGDGSFMVSNPNTNPSTYSYPLYHDELVKVFKAGNVTITGGGDENSYIVFIIRYNNDADKIEINTFKGGSPSVEIPQTILDDPTSRGIVGIYSKPRTDAITVKPMLYQDGDGTWERYKPIQTFTIPTPNGLPAVPVSSGGNYTDASGQQWICDEIDYERGVYVQRVYKYEVTGDENWRFHSEVAQGYYRYDCSVSIPINKGESNKVDFCMNTHFQHKSTVNASTEGCWITSTTYDSKPVVGLRICVSAAPTLSDMKQIFQNQYAMGTPVTFQYILNEPIETPLSDEEINAHKELHTLYPHTSIHNSENAHMAVDYVADTKNYVDNQIKKEVAELTAAILTQ